MILGVHVFLPVSTQTAEIILKNNLHSADVEMVLDPLLRERVSISHLSQFFITVLFSNTYRYSVHFGVLDHAAQADAVCLVSLVWIWLHVVQGFGVAEGRPKEDLKNMANAAGQACRDFTPPGGETLEQVNFSA